MTHFDAGPIEDLRRRAERVGRLVLRDTWLREHASTSEVERAIRSVEAGEDPYLAYSQIEAQGWWTDATAAAALVGALPPLKLREGWSLATYAHRDRMGGHGLTFARPLGSPVSLPPGPPGETDPPVPTPVPAAVLEWDPDEPMGFLIASIALRELEQVAADWHGLWWSTESLLGGHDPVPYIPRLQYAEYGEAPPDFAAFTYDSDLPDRWDPQVRRDEDGAVTVEMYTYRGRSGERIWRHVDRYGRVGEPPQRQVTAVARGGFGYVY